MSCRVCGRPVIVEGAEHCGWCVALSPGARTLCASLSSSHRGRAGAIKIEAIFHALRPLLTGGTTQEEFRTFKEELIEAKHPICSSQRGWWYAADLEEARAGSAFYKSLASDLHLKASRIEAGALELYGPQLHLPGLA